MFSIEFMNKIRTISPDLHRSVLEAHGRDAMERLIVSFLGTKGVSIGVNIDPPDIIETVVTYHGDIATMFSHRGAVLEDEAEDIYLECLKLI